jgi:carbonic anhydrase/acetyltransferase-like protein (isoleucine patch superfamily)
MRDLEKRLEAFLRKEPALGKHVLVARGAVVLGDVTLGDYSSVWFNAVLRGDDDRIEIGAGSNIQDATVIHCDHDAPTIVGRNVTVGHRVLLHGCTIGEDCLIGNGAIVLDGVRIGARCLIGAGSMLTPGKEFPDGSVVMGSPARIVRPVGERELALIERGTRSYRERIQRYRAEAVRGQVPGRD